MKRVDVRKILNGVPGAVLEALSEGEHGLTFGVGRSADVALTRWGSLPDVCATLCMDPEDGCLIRNETRDPSLVLINEGPVYTICRLEDGDVLQVGHDLFSISIGRAQQRIPVVLSPPTPVEVAAPVPPPVSSYQLQCHALNSAVSCFTPADRLWLQEEAVTGALNCPGTIVLANYRHAGIRQPEIPDVGDDLLKAAPEEVRQLCSLHAVFAAPVEEKLQVVRSLQGKDACVVVLPEKGDAKACLEGSRLYFGWLSRPVALELTLTKGSSQLAESMLRHIRAVMVCSRSNDSQWKVFAKAGTSNEDLQICFCRKSF